MKKIFVLTGEPSGDKLASKVISKLQKNDPNIELFDELFKALQALENNAKNNNIVFWFFQYQVLSRLGFRPDFSQTDINNTPLPNPYKSRNSKAIFDSFENNEPYLQTGLVLTSEDRRTVSNYLNSSLSYLNFP